MNIVPPAYAQTPIPIGDVCGGSSTTDTGLGPFAAFLCKFNTSPDPNPVAVEAVGSFALIISNVIGLMTVIAGIWFVFQFLIAGYKWMSSVGDKGKLQEAQNHILHAVIGLIIAVSAYAIVNIVSATLGIDLLLGDPARFVELISPKP